MSAEVAELMRRMDALLGDDPAGRRGRVREAFQYAGRIFRLWSADPRPWPAALDAAMAALGPTPLAYPARVHGILEGYCSGGIPGWCWEWSRSTDAELAVTPDPPKAAGR